MSPGRFVAGVNRDRDGIGRIRQGMGIASREHFFKVHERARFSDLWARVAGKSNDLLPFDALLSVLQNYQRLPRRQPEMIPLAKIVGSVGRYRDFTRDFKPRTAAMAERWARVEEGIESPLGLPPIDVFQIGDVYFVIDGNHRVSVARANGFEYIEANVTEIPLDAGLEPGDTLDEAIIKAGRARFIAETGLSQLVEQNEDITFTSPGGYTALLEQVIAHQRQLSDQRGAEVSLAQAAEDWYLSVFRPGVAVIRDLQLISHFPGRTPADLYIWVSRYVLELSQIYGEPISTVEAAHTLELTAPSPFKAALMELMRRLSRFTRVFNRAAADLPEWVESNGEVEWDTPPLAHLR